MRNPLANERSVARSRRGRPRGATSWSRKLPNVAAHQANVLLELWLADAPVLELRVLLFSLADNPEHQALIEECWRAAPHERRYTVPPKIKRKLCKLAGAHATEMRCQAMMHQQMRATQRRLRRRGDSDARIDAIMRRHVPERPHVEPPDIEKVLELVNRHAPPVSLRRKARERILRR